MTTMITGSSGHLGEALVRQLTALSLPVRGIDIKPSACTDALGSITDSSFVDQQMCGVRTVLHTATLHKPHVATHSRQQFIDTNVTGTLNLLEAAARHGVETFIFTSTTSTFGDAMRHSPGTPAVWINESVKPIPKNIYGVSKTAAEDLCQLFHRDHGLACLVLRTSRFFPEEDDTPELSNAYEGANLKANELLFRRTDLQDVVDAHLLAMQQAGRIGFDRFIISTTTPFTREDSELLGRDAVAVVASRFPGFQSLYEERGWRMLPVIGRVYDNTHARTQLNWQPAYDFQHVLNCLASGRELRSPLALSVGSKGYH